MTDYSDAIVAEYLRRLDVAAAPLPLDRRSELVGEIADHIAQARSSGQAADEASLRELLDRLGEPAEIVAEARDGEADAGGFGGGADPFGPTPAAQVQQLRSPRIGLEIAAVAMLTVGSIIPLLGWLTGAVLLWASRRFTLAEKVLATLVVPGGPFAAVLLVGASGQTCTSSDATGTAATTTCTGFALPLWLGLPVLVAAVVGPFVVGGILLKRAGERAALEAPVPVLGPPSDAGNSRWGALEVAAVLLLAVGGLVVPLAAPAAGLVCAWLSGAWTTTEKWVATAIAALVLIVPLLGLLAVGL